MAADYWSQAQIDPAYIAQHGGNRQSLINALLNNGDASSAFARAPGIDPTTNQPYKTLAETYNIGQNDVAGAATNPYSTQAQLAKLLSSDQYGITNNANAHGALFSGAHQAQQLGELANAGQRNYGAQQALQGQIAGIGQNDTNSLTDAYGRIASDAALAPIPAAPTPAAAPAFTPPPTDSLMSQPAPAPAVGSGLGAQVGFNPQAPQNQPIKIAKPKQLTGYQGHA